MIKKCKCKSDCRGNTNAAEYQDKKYGQGNRVHTETAKIPKSYKCTVCGDVK